MTAHATGDIVGFKVVDYGSEMGQSIKWPPRENGIAAVVQHPQCVKTSEDVAAGLVDDSDHQSPAVGHLLQQVHQQFRIFTAEATGRFVYQQNLRASDKLHGNVEPFALPSTDGFVECVSHREVAGFPESQLLQADLDALLGLGPVIP